MGGEFDLDFTCTVSCFSFTACLAAGGEPRKQLLRPLDLAAGPRTMDGDARIEATDDEAPRGHADLPEVAEDASSSAFNADGVPSDGGAQEPPADSSKATAGSSASAAYPSKKAMKRAKKDEYFAARKQAKKMEIKEEKAQRRASRSWYSCC